MDVAGPAWAAAAGAPAWTDSITWEDTRQQLGKAGAVSSEWCGLWVWQQYKMLMAHC